MIRKKTIQKIKNTLNKVLTKAKQLILDRVLAWKGNQVGAWEVLVVHCDDPWNQNTVLL